MTADPPGEADAVGDEILRALRRILRRVTLHSRQMLRDTGLSLPQVLALRAIGEMQGGHATQVALSRTLQLTQPTVTGILDRLERAGLVRRERSTSDRRKIGISLTDTGRARLSSLPTPLQEQFMLRLMQLSVEERTTLLQSLNRVVALMEAEAIDAAPILLPDADVKPAPADE
jgi:DNA-binding MarR family transcriptional regulator